MPNCFQLSRRESKEFTPVPLNTIDEEMCKHFNVPVHPNWYYKEWYNTVGFSLAMGLTFAEIREKQMGDPQVVDWLEANFVSSAFYQPK